MAPTLSKILPPTRSARTVFVASWLLGLCALLQLTFLAVFVGKGGARSAAFASSATSAGPFVPRFSETTQPSVTAIDPQVVSGPTVTESDPPNTGSESYSVLPQPTPVPGQRLPGGTSGDTLDQARALRQRGDMRAALSRLREALVADPDNPQAIAEMALTYEAMQLPDKAGEEWQRIYNMGASVGTPYALADARLHGGTGGSAGGSSVPGAGTADTTMLKITNIDVEDIPDPAVEKKVALKIVVKGRPGVVIDPEKVRIDANFYDLVDGKDIVQTNAQTDFAWLTPPPINWANDKSEVLEALYVRQRGVALMPDPSSGGAPASTRTGSRRNNGRNARGKPTPAPETTEAQPSPGDASATVPVRVYLGYSVRLYYAGQLQEVQADPVRLLQDFQAPLNLPPDSNPALDTTPAPR